jgi:hypothetical protein
VFALALAAAAIAGLIARWAGGAVDGFFAFLVAWLLFGLLFGCFVFFWGIFVALQGEGLERFAHFSAITPIVIFFALWFGSGPALVACLVYQGTKFLIIGK